MDFVSAPFYLFLAVVLVAYYVLPLRWRWCALLAGSIAYFWLATGSRRSMAIFLGVIAFSWAAALLIERMSGAPAKGDGRHAAKNIRGGRLPGLGNWSSPRP